MNNNSANGTVEPFFSPEFSSVHIALVVLGALIVLFNLVVLLVMWKNNLIKKPENGLLASLAVSDLSVGVAGLPLLFACTFTPIHLCPLCWASFYFVMFISISTVLHILAVIAERYLLVLHPFVHRRIRSKMSHSRTMIAAIWLVSLIVSNIPWIWMDVNCHLDIIEVWNPDFIYQLVSLPVFFFIPLVLISIFLVKIYLAARRFVRRDDERRSSLPSERLQTRRKEMQVVAMLSAMFLIFVFCWVPYFVAILASHVKAKFPEWLESTVVILRCLTSVLNPVLYSFYKEDVYQAFKSDVRKLFRCNQRIENNTTENQQVLVTL